MIAVARYWREIVIGVLGLALMASVLVLSLRIEQRTGERDRATAALEQTKTAYAEAQATARAANLANVRAIEQANAKATQEIQNDLSTQLADARAAGAAYAARLRGETEATRRAARAAGVSNESDAAGRASDADRASVMAENIRICSDNTVKVEGWRRWYEALR